MAGEAEEKKISKLDFDINNAIKKLETIDNKLKEVSKTSEKYAETIGNAFGSGVDKKNIDKNILDIKKSYKEMTAYEKNRAADLSLFKQKEEIKTTEVLKREHAKQAKSVETLSDKITNYAKTYLIYQGFNQLKRGIAETIEEMVELEYQMVAIDRVLNESHLNINEYRDELLQLAYDYGNSMDNVTDVALRLAQAGYDSNEVLALTEKTLLALNTAELNATEATSDMIAVMAQWGLMTGTATEQAETYGDIIDKINIVADRFPTTSQDLMNALKKTSSAFNLAGASIEETIALITTAEVASQRGGKAIGTALGNITQQLKDEGRLTIAESLGLDFYTDETKTQFKDIIEIFGEMSSKMQELKDAGKENSVEMQNLLSIFTVFRRNVGASLLGGMADEAGTYTEVMKTLNNSLNYSMQENEKHMQTTKAAQAQFNATLLELKTKVWDNGVEDVYRAMLELGTDVAKGISWLVDTFGALPVVISSVVAVMTLFNKQLRNTKIIKSFTIDVKNLSDVFEMYNKDVVSGNMTSKQFVQFLGKDLPKSQRVAIKGLNGATVSMNTFKAATIAAQVGVSLLQATLSFGLSLAISKVIELVTDLVDNIIHASEKAVERFDEAQQKTQEAVSDLEEVNIKLDEQKTKLEELQSIDSPKLADEIETEKLQADIELLERKKQTMQDIVDVSKREEAEKAADLYNIKERFGSGNYRSFTDYLSTSKKTSQVEITVEGTKSDKLLAEMEKYRRYIKIINREIENDTGKTVEQLGNDLTGLEASIGYTAEDLIRMRDSLSAVDEEIQKEKGYDELIDNIDSVLGKYDEYYREKNKLEEEDVKQTQALSEEWFNELSDRADKTSEKMNEILGGLTKEGGIQKFISDLGDGDLTKYIEENFEDAPDIVKARLKEIVEAYMDGTMSIEKANEALSLAFGEEVLDKTIIESNNELIELFGDNKEVVDGMIDTYKELANTFANVASIMSNLKTAQQEMNDVGHLSANTILDLLSKNEDYADVMQIVNGKVVLVKNAEELLTGAKIDAIRKSAELAVAEAETALAQYDAGNSAVGLSNVLGTGLAKASGHASKGVAFLTTLLETKSISAAKKASAEASRLITTYNSIGDMTSRASLVSDLEQAKKRLAIAKTLTVDSFKVSSGSGGGTSSSSSSSSSKDSEKDEYEKKLALFTDYIDSLEEKEVQWVRKQKELGALSYEDERYIIKQRILRYQQYLAKIKEMTWLSVEDRMELEEDYLKTIESSELEYMKLLKNELETEIKTIEDANKEKIKVIEDSADTRIDKLKEENEAAIELIEKEADARIEALQAVEKENDRIRAKEEYERNRKAHLDDISYWEQRTGREAQEALVEARKALEELDRDWEQQLEDWKIEDQIVKIEEERDAQIAAIEATQAKEIEAIETTRDAEIAAIEATQQKEIDALQAVYDAKIKMYSETGRIIYDESQIASQALYNLYKTNFIDPISSELQEMYAQVPAATPQQGSYETYTIQRGDTLSRIASRYGTTVSKLMEANPYITNANMIYAGKTLQIPKFHDGGIVGGNQEAFALLKPNEVVLKTEWASSLNRMMKYFDNLTMNNLTPVAGGPTIEVNGDLIKIEANVRNQSDVNNIQKKIEKVLKDKFNIKK